MTKTTSHPLHHTRDQAERAAEALSIVTARFEAGESDRYCDHNDEQSAWDEASHLAGGIEIQDETGDGLGAGTASAGGWIITRGWKTNEWAVDEDGTIERLSEEEFEAWLEDAPGAAGSTGDLQAGGVKFCAGGKEVDLDRYLTDRQAQDKAFRVARLHNRREAIDRRALRRVFFRRMEELGRPECEGMAR